MKIRLLSYDNAEHFVDIPDDTEELIILVVSGDMVMTQPVFYDTGMGSRVMDFRDGSVCVPKDLIPKMASLNHRTICFLLSMSSLIKRMLHVHDWVLVKQKDKVVYDREGRFLFEQIVYIQECSVCHKMRRYLFDL